MTTNHNGQYEADDRDRVAAAFCCPKCGEDHIDYLVWIGDDKVRCAICGKEYDPNPDTDE